MGRARPTARDAARRARQPLAAALALGLVSTAFVGCASLLGIEEGEPDPSRIASVSPVRDAGPRSSGDASSAETAAEATARRSRWEAALRVDDPVASYAFAETAAEAVVRGRPTDRVKSPETDGVLAGALPGAPGVFVAAGDAALRVPTPDARTQVRFASARFPHADAPFSLELWVAPSLVDPRATSTLVARLTAVGGASFRGFRLLVAPGAKPRVERSTGTGAGAEGTTARTALEGGRWTHLAATFDGARLRIFVNGAVEGEVRTSGSVGALPPDLVLGGDPATGTLPLPGAYDELALYDRELDPAQVANHVRAAAR